MIRIARPGARVKGGRPRRHVGFFVVTSAVVAFMVFGMVAINALVAQGSFRIDDLAAQVDHLSERYLELTHEAASLSAPDRIAAWARRHGMRLPDEIHILHVPAAGPAAPVGESDQPVPKRPSLKAMVEGQSWHP